MAEYLDLDYCADSILTEDEAWRAARMVSGAVIGQLIEGAPDVEACFVLADASDHFYDMLEQLPFAEGVLEMRFATLEGMWHPNRAQDDGLYHWPPRQQPVHGDAVALAVYHDESRYQLLNVALPLDSRTAELIRYGTHTSSESPAYAAIDSLAEHEQNRAHAYPRQVQAAAWLAREALYGAAVPIPAYSPRAMLARTKWAGHTAQSHLSQIPIFTV